MCFFFVVRLLSLPGLNTTFPSLWFRVEPQQPLRGEVNQFRGLAVYVCDSFSVYRQCDYECGCCEVIVVRNCSRSHNFYVFGVDRNPDLWGKFFGSLLTTIAKLQSVSRKTSFLFVGDVSAHHEELLVSFITNLHDRAARNFASSLGCRI